MRSNYRIMLIVEERGDESSGSELIDFTRTLGYTNDLDLADQLMESLLAQGLVEAKRLGITPKNPDPKELDL